MRPLRASPILKVNGRSVWAEHFESSKEDAPILSDYGAISFGLRDKASP